jgi:hypothetical protein
VLSEVGDGGGLGLEGDAKNEKGIVCQRLVKSS